MPINKTEYKEWRNQMYDAPERDDPDFKYNLWTTTALNQALWLKIKTFVDLN